MILFFMLFKHFAACFCLFQWQTSGSTNTAKSSNIAAALTLKSEGGREGGWSKSWTPWSTRPCLYNWEAHLQAEGRRAAQSEHTGKGGESLHLWLEARAPGSPRRAAESYGGHGQTAHGWKAVCNQPPEAKRSLTSSGQERGICICTLSWFQLTVKSCLLLRSSPLPKTGPTLGSVVTNQHSSRTSCEICRCSSLHRCLKRLAESPWISEISVMCSQE